MMLQKLSNLSASHLVLVTVWLNKIKQQTQNRGQKDHLVTFLCLLLLLLYPSGDGRPAAVEAGPVGPSRPLAVTIPPVGCP